MNLQPINVPDGQRHFTTFCLRCNLVVGSWEGIHIDRDGCPLRSYLCGSCALNIKPEEAIRLANIARKLVHTNA
jgi:hypothetical protein